MTGVLRRTVVRLLLPYSSIKLFSKFAAVDYCQTSTTTRLHSAIWQIWKSKPLKIQCCRTPGRMQSLGKFGTANYWKPNISTLPHSTIKSIWNSKLLKIKYCRTPYFRNLVTLEQSTTEKLVLPHSRIPQFSKFSRLEPLKILCCRIPGCSKSQCFSNNLRTKSMIKYTSYKNVRNLLEQLLSCKISHKIQLKNLEYLPPQSLACEVYRKQEN